LYADKGEAAFWEKDNRQGHAYKVTPGMLIRIQQSIDKGESVLSIAKREGITESNIRYYIKKGDLKKKLLIRQTHLPGQPNGESVITMIR
jgi:hypothetical protein